MENFFNNILETGSIIASPSKDPDYNFHWVRDSAIVMKSVITLFEKERKNQKYMKIIENYIKTECEHINFHPAEPKFLLDKTPYLGDWGRPQNDGPALRGIVCLKLLKVYGRKQKDLLKIIFNDLSYTIEQLEEPCFDLWEEEYGYHLYTRMVQYKFLCECLYSDKVQYEDLNERIVNRSRELLGHHFSGDNIYSSYDIHGQILRECDSSVLLGLSHVDYKLDEFDCFSDNIKNYAYKMISVFTDIYPINKKLNIPFLGRYFNDKYFDGNPWIISTIALYQYSFVCPNFYYNKNEFKNFLKFLYDDKKLLLSEQIHRETGEDVSVEKLTWNYSELITLFKFIKNFQIDNLIDLFVTE